MSKFVFGTATASFQIEGATSEGGRTPSIWDTFCAEPGRVKNGDDGSMACDHYHHYKEDIAMMAELGVDSYRFSIAWPRIFPVQGQYNDQGMQFYRDIIEELKKRGIKAAVTLYHWDLPQWAQDQGGWENRECANWFAEYADKCFAELDGDVEMWITHNEPWCASFLSNHIGEHAPGNRDLEKALRVAHHLMLSHGMAVEHYRSQGRKGQIGITLNLAPVYAKSEAFRDQLAQVLQDGYQNRWFLDPIFKKRYPTDMAALFGARTGCDFDFIEQGDLDVIAAPIDFLGINFYTHSVTEYCAAGYILTNAGHTNLPKTAMGWDVCPDTLIDLVRMVRENYTKLPVYITENGCAYEDHVENNKVNDTDRVSYLHSHLAAVEKINQAGLDVAGYYYWSFMDNFEWAHGYSKRFGLVYLDYETQKRIPKDSFYAYQDYIRQHKK